MPHILIIDDEGDIRALVALILKGEGYEVTEAANGFEGLEKLAEAGADCILLDVMMPDMTGWEVCHRVKSNPATAGIPVVIFTVRSMIRDGDRFETSRADGYINKPFEFPELLDMVRKLLAARESAQAQA